MPWRCFKPSEIFAWTADFSDFPPAIFNFLKLNGLPQQGNDFLESLKGGAPQRIWQGEMVGYLGRGHEMQNWFELDKPYLHQHSFGDIWIYFFGYSTFVTHTHTQNSQCALKQVLSIILKQCTWWLWVTFGCCLERWRFCRDLHFQWNLQAGPVEKYTSGSQLMSLELVLGLEFGSHHHSLTACGTLSQCGKNWCTQGRMLSIQDVLDRFYCSMRGVCFQACGCQVLFPVHMSWTADEERRILMLDFGAFWILASRMQSLVF